MLADLRYALRLLRKNPGFAALAIATLALGIGATTAVFTVVNALLIRPLPYKDPARLVVVWDQLSKLGLRQFAVTFANYADYRDQNQVFEDIAAFQYADFSLTGPGGQPERVVGMRVSAGLFPLLGAEAALGRTFVPEENRPGRGEVAILSHALFERRFGAVRTLIGNPITIAGNLFTVIGVMPPGFQFATRSGPAPDLWVPITFAVAPSRTAGALQLLARLKHGIALERAQADMSTIAARIEQEYHPFRGPRGEDAGYSVSVVPLREQLFGSVRQGLIVLLGAVGLLLLIACANVASLLLAKAAARQKEMAIRAALGAERRRTLRQLLTESVLLGLLGGSLGLTFAFWGVDALVALSPATIPRPEHIGVDLRVLAFTSLLSLLTGIVFGLAPALVVSRPDLTTVLKASTSGGHETSLYQFLVAGELALSLALLIGAGLLIKSLARLQSVDPGFQPAAILTAQISLPASRYPEARRAAAFYDQLLGRIEQLPEIESAGVASRLPLSFAGRGGDPFSIEGRPYNPTGKVPQLVQWQAASPNYLRTMQVPLLAGRHLTERDTAEAAPVAIVNETMARGFWSSRDEALGKHIMLGAPRPGAPWLTIVGVAGDVRNAGLSVLPVPQMYLPQVQIPSRAMAIVIRGRASRSDAGSLISTLRNQVLALDPEQPIHDVRTMEQRLAASLSQPRFQTVLLAVFAALALLLVAAGIYGVVAHAVAQRTREIGIRMALGALPGSVVFLIVKRAMSPALIGVGVGLAAALSLGRVLSSLLYEVAPADPAICAAASTLVVAVAFLACYVPARRAARLDPMAALREQ